ncbi:MAG: hypothetical protein HYY65_05065 [Candidatus Tectomicrobia bacterium]|uniref:Uncharacterized protein n=1 Tax=Tectimicrobiota bacterium TaxID=2528274 RepID=A0A932GNJ2_UNCTE|nr:hypothetical protein [Candidatus Tectomicrobia bacterium]
MTLEEINLALQKKNVIIDGLSTSSSPAPVGTAASSWWSVTDAMTISASVLVFGLLVILLATYLIRAGKHTEAVLRIFGTILIVMVAVFLVVAGYTDTQIAPVMGLLGTIAGYLLGKETKET